MGDSRCTPVAPLALKGVVQHYAWGSCGAGSLVARLSGLSSDSRPCAELWFGAHPKGAALAGDGSDSVRLDQLIASAPEAILGKRVAAAFGDTLPFLFKILSVGQALSIQAHPDRDNARKLHQERPEHYPDCNHKPEMAIALSRMELLYGFRRVQEIIEQCAHTPELSAVIGAERLAALQQAQGANVAAALREVHRELLLGDQVTREKQLKLLSERLEGAVHDPHDLLAKKLLAVYGTADTGILTSYIMNICTLETGEAIWIGPNIPHAYLYGDMVECMANSDNVVRAGLTGKFQDAEVLLAMLRYEESPPVRVGESRPPGVFQLREFDVPVREFRIAEIAGRGSVELHLNDGPALVFCLEGSVELTASGHTVSLTSGGAAIVPASALTFHVAASELCRIFKVTVP